MKAVFIVPEYSIASKDNNFFIKMDDDWEYHARSRLWSCPSLSLITIAGMMPKDSNIKYIDLNYTHEFEVDADWAFFSPATSQVNRAYKLADNLRSKGIKVAMGGPHVSFLPDEALLHSDVVFVGESENTFSEFLSNVDKNITKRIYKESRYPDLSLTPMPAYYLTKQYPYKSIPMQTSRGCPHQCSFCISSKIYGNKIRCKTSYQMDRDVQAIKDLFKKPYIFFTDDNLFIDKRRNDSFLSIMKNSHLNWYAFSDAGVADNTKLLSEIADAGCTQLLIGFESLCSENLQDLNKNSWKMKKLNFYKDIINRIQSFGIGVVGSFVVGMENDTVDVFENLYKFIEETSLYATNITILTPFPGTEIYEKFKREGRLLSNDWSVYNGFELTYKPNNMTIEELQKGYVDLNIKLNSTERMKRVIDHFKVVLTSKN